MTTAVDTQTTDPDTVGTELDRGIQHGSSHYTPEQRDQLRALGQMGEASDGDLDMLAAVAQRTGLDPFIKQIYLVGRKTKVGGYRGEPESWETVWTVQTGIEGFRAVTHRYAAQKGASVNISEPVFYTEDGQERPFWLKKWGEPAACKITIRIGESEATHIATWEEYAQRKADGSLTNMWRKFGQTMLAKCAESGAHRKICPLNAGLYSSDEMSQADTPPVRAQARRQPQQAAESGQQSGLAAIQNAVAQQAQQAAQPQAQPETAPQTADADATPDSDDADEAAEQMAAIRASIDSATTKTAIKDMSATVKAADDFTDEQKEELLAAGRDKWRELDEKQKSKKQ